MKKNSLTSHSYLFAVLLVVVFSFTSCTHKISSSEDLAKAISGSVSMKQIDKCIESVQFDERVKYQKEMGKVILNDKEGRNAYTHKACVAYLYIVIKNADDVIYNKITDSQKSILYDIDNSDSSIRTAAVEILGPTKVSQMNKNVNSYYPWCSLLQY